MTTLSNLTGAEKVLRKAELDFHLTYCGATQEEAEKLADEKIIKTRNLVRNKNIVKF